MLVMAGDSLMCPICDALIQGDYLMCDGICGNRFHPACPRRSLRSSSNSPFTCQTCSDIKPCHVLKALLLLNTTLEANTDKLSGLDHSLSSMRTDIELLYSDRDVVLSRLDGIQECFGAVTGTTSKIADNVHKNLSTTKRLESLVDELGVSPDISYLKDELAGISDRLLGLGKQLRSLQIHDSVSPGKMNHPNEPTPDPATVRSPLSITHSRAPTTLTGLPPSYPSVHPSPPVLPTMAGRPTPSTKSSTQVVGLTTTGSTESRPLNSPEPTYIVHPPNSPLPPLCQPCYPPPPSRSSVDPPVIAGQPFSHPITPYPDINWIPNESLRTIPLHVGKCHILTSEDMIRTFISTELLIPLNSVRCHKLISASRSLADYSFSSFKVNIPASFAQKALSHAWPPNVNVTPFQFKPRPLRKRLNTEPLNQASKNDNPPLVQSVT